MLQYFHISNEIIKIMKMIIILITRVYILCHFERYFLHFYFLFFFYLKQVICSRGEKGASMKNVPQMTKRSKKLQQVEASSCSKSGQGSKEILLIYTALNASSLKLVSVYCCRNFLEDAEKKTQ